MSTPFRSVTATDNGLTHLIVARPALPGALHRVALLVSEHREGIPPKALYITVNSFGRPIDVLIMQTAGTREQRFALVDRLAQICGNPAPKDHTSQGSSFYVSESPGWHIYTIDDIAEDGAA